MHGLHRKQWIQHIDRLKVSCMATRIQLQPPMLKLIIMHMNFDMKISRDLSFDEDCAMQ